MQAEAAPQGVRRAPKRRRRSRLIVGLVALALIGTAGAYGVTHYRAAGETEAVVTQAVTRGDIENSVTATGLLTPIRDVDVGAQVSGQLKSVKVEIGDQVKEGDLVAEIDSASIETQIEIAEAEIANLEAQMVDKRAQVVLANSTLARQQTLVAGNTAARSALDEAVAALATAEANVAALDAQIRKQQASLKDARISLGHTKIFAPLTGTVVDIAAKEGQTLNANQSTPTIATVADLSTMTVEAEVSEADIGKLSPGMDAYFTLLGQPGKRFPGKLRQIKPTPQTENNVILYYALFDVPNPEGQLMMNMTAQVFFVRDHVENVLTVPIAALKGRAEGHDAKVTVVKPDGGRETRDVTVGVRNRVAAEIKSGLQDGEIVVVGSGAKDAASGANRGNNRRNMPPPPF
ncbi:macrolide transporter subunit MacA [Xaviernesmea oryzae]|nr:macrolide transporter subunit MacA [Xaviernesmea oryzae]